MGVCLSFSKNNNFSAILANKQPDLRKRRKVLQLNVGSQLSEKYLDSKTFEFFIYNGTLKYVEKHSRLYILSELSIKKVTSTYR